MKFFYSLDPVLHENLPTDKDNDEREELRDRLMANPTLVNCLNLDL